MGLEILLLKVPIIRYKNYIENKILFSQYNAIIILESNNVEEF